VNEQNRVTPFGGTDDRAVNGGAAASSDEGATRRSIKELVAFVGFFQSLHFLVVVLQ
jgi:hypothetical protein